MLVESNSLDRITARSHLTQMMSPFVIDGLDRIRTEPARAEIHFEVSPVICELTFFDFADIYYSSYFLKGLSSVCKESNIVFGISKRKPPILDCPDMEGFWSDVLFSIMLFRVKDTKGNYYFCIDARDSADPSPDRGVGYHLPMLAHVDRYFKCNYNPSIASASTELRPFFAKITPLTLFFPVRPPHLTRLLPRIRECREAGWTRESVVRRIRALANLPSLNEYRSLRSTPLNLDVVFVSGFYGRPDPTEGDNFRYEVMKSIKSIPDLTCRVGFVSRGVLSGKFAELQIRPMHLHEYLRQLARCRIGIYVRGAHNCLSFKLGQLLALGKPMVGQSIPNSNGSISRIPFFQRQFGYDSPKQIAARVWELSRDAEQRQEIGSANMTAYEQHFTPEAVAKLILRSLVEGRS